MRGSPSSAFQTWGWRVPFLLSVLLIGVGLYIQLRLEDTPAFRHLEEYRETRRSQGEPSVARAASPVIEALKTYPKQISLAAGAFVAINANFFVLSTYMVDYGTSELGLSRPTVLAAILIAAATAFPAILGFAALSDVIGRRATYMAGAVLLGLWAFALWPLVDTRSAGALVLALVVGQVFLSAMYGSQAAFFSEMFSTRVRYSGASLGYQIGAILGGALAPTIATLLYAEFENSFAIAVYMAVVCAITFVSVYLLAETYQTTVDDAEAGHGVAGGRDTSRI